MQKFDLEKEYGLVLEGGGAKGAYQIGVWKALREYGVKIRGIAGVSVGALNGALICMDDYELAVRLWNNITYSQIMDVDDIRMRKLVKGNIKDLGINEIASEGIKFLVSRGFDIQPLRELINEYLDEERVKQSSIPLYIGTICLSELKEIEVIASESEEGYLKDYLLASAYLPGFRNEKLHGKKYLDGGMLNNVPIDMLIRKGYENIIVVRIYGPGLEKKIKIPDNVNLIEIAPRVSLGSLLDFDGDRSRKNMKIGYYDAVRALESLNGKIYYLKDEEEESHYLMKCFQIHKSVKMAFIEYYRLDYTEPNVYDRIFLEQVCPRIAADLKLDKYWTYKELYMGMLELSAKNMEIQKYKIYGIDELGQLIANRYEQLKNDDDMLIREIFHLRGKSMLFIRLVLKAIIIQNYFVTK